MLRKKKKKKHLIVQEELLLRELSSIKEQQKNVSKQYEKKKADCKALVREVKRLRHVQRKLEEEKSEAEVVYFYHILQSGLCCI